MQNTVKKANDKVLIDKTLYSVIQFRKIGEDQGDN